MRNNEDLSTCPVRVRPALAVLVILLFPLLFGTQRMTNAAPQRVFEIGSHVSPSSLNGVFSHVVASNNYTLALRPDGSLVAWGNNVYGQCTPPPALWRSVSGRYTLCAGVTDAGELRLWGEHQHWWDNMSQPNTGYVAVAAGMDHVVALRTDGSITCFGSNYASQCNVPQPNAGFVAVGAGMAFSAGLKADGTVVVWGDNRWGQCNVPAEATHVVQIAVGDGHVVALTQSGTIVCWGANHYDQCIPPGDGGPYTSVAAYGALSGAVTSTGQLKLWGCDANVRELPHPNTNLVAASLGADHIAALHQDGTLLLSAAAAQPPVADFAAIAPGYLHTVGLLADGRLLCWGSNRYGQCTPPSAGPFIAVSAGENHSAAITTAGKVVCWGDNSYGKSWPTEPNGPYIQVACGTNHTAALRTDGSVVCWGQYDLLSVPWPNRGFVAISADRDITLGLKQDGSVVSWGRTANVGRPPYPNFGYVSALTDDLHQIALTPDGRIECWGWQTNWMDVAPTPNYDFVAIGIGRYCSAGLKRDGAVVTWGMPPRSAQPLIADRLWSGNGRILASVTVMPVVGRAMIDGRQAPAGTSLVAHVWREGDSEPAEIVEATTESDGAFRLDVVTPPPYRLFVGSPKCLRVTCTVTHLNRLSLAVSLLSGDVDGDNRISLFDYLMLDQALGSGNKSADVDGDGEITLFDYLVVDRNYGAEGL